MFIGVEKKKEDKTRRPGFLRSVKIKKATLKKIKTRFFYDSLCAKPTKSGKAPFDRGCPGEKELRTFIEFYRSVR